MHDFAAALAARRASIDAHVSDRGVTDDSALWIVTPRPPVTRPAPSAFKPTGGNADSSPMTVLPPPACPVCRAELGLHTEQDFDAWVCPSGHGLAFTLSEAYERVGDDEIHAIWARANATDAAASTRGCPMCERTMVTVACEAVTIDVCVVDEVFWFDVGELERVPAHVDAPGPSAEERAEIDEITDDFGDALVAGWDDEERHTITGRLAAHLLPSRAR